MVSKKKSSNPIDAHRKAARARELKKNRERREEAREVSLVKRDTRGLEKDIQALSARKNISTSDQEELSKLRAELKRVKTAKEEYLAKHPEHRRFVYPREEEGREPLANRTAISREQQQHTSNELHNRRDPRRSIYYHEIFNPHGAPPPGMPYMEKSAEQWESEQRQAFEVAMRDSRGEGVEENDGEGDLDEAEEDEEDDSDDDIALPVGPPPLSEEAPVDVKMGGSSRRTQFEQDAEGDSSEDSDGIIMPSGPPPGPPTAPRAMQEDLPTGPATMNPRPPNMVSMYVRPPPPTYRPRPPLGPSPSPMPTSPWPAAASRPMQNFPLLRPGAGLAASPPGPPPSRPPTVITSAPVLRDLKKEATSFVPPALRKKQAALKAQAAKSGLPSVVDSAPSNASSSTNERGHRDGEERQMDEKVDLLASLKPHLIGKATGTTDSKQDDYKRFLGEMSGLL